MCNLDVIAGPAPILLGGTVVFAITVGVLLLCGIALVTVGFIRSRMNKKTEKEQAAEVISKEDTCEQ